MTRFDAVKRIGEDYTREHGRIRMREYLLNLLKQLEIAIAPPEGCHHAIMHSQYGNDESGWEDRLALQLNLDGQFVTLFLDDDDFNLTYTELARKIKEYLEVQTAKDRDGHLVIGNPA